MLTVLGQKIVKLLQDLLASEEVDSKSYDEHVNLLYDNFRPTKLIFMKDLNLTAEYNNNESVTDYVVQIKNLC